MSFARACAFLLLASARNWALAQLRRLRRARYLVPAALGAGYLTLVLLGNARNAEALRGVPLARSLVAALEGARPTGAIALTAIALLSWVLGKPTPRLGFTEAEIQFLFPAPVPRRAAVHFRLVKVAVGGALLALLPAAAMASLRGGAVAPTALGLAIAVATLNLHGVAASLVRADLHLRLPGWRLRAAQVALLAALAAVVAGGLRGDPVLGAPARAMLWPAQALLAPLLAEGTRELLRALPGALLVLGAHYAFDAWAAVGFEDAAVAHAEQAARRLEQLRIGGVAALAVGGRRKRTPFRLAGRGRPELALTWKGLIAMSRSLQLRIVAVALAATFAGMALVGALTGPSSFRTFAWVMPLVALFLAGVMGPAAVGGSGLAADLGHLDVLRSLPVTGPRLVLGQSLAPALLLSAIWCAAAPAVALLEPFGLDAGARWALAAALLLAGPPLLLLGVALQALFAALLPGWVPRGPRSAGGHILPMLVQVIGLPLAALPAVFTAALVAWLGRPLLGWSVAPVAAVAGDAALAACIAIALGLAGRAFERIDPSDV